MMHMQSLPWAEPLTLAASVDEPYWVFLHSGAGNAGTSGFSLLAHSLCRKIEDSGWEKLEQSLTAHLPRWENAWFGYFGYELKNALEQLPADPAFALRFPALCFMQFNHIYVFDHAQRRLERWSRLPDQPALTPSSPAPVFAKAIHVRSNMRRDEYLQKAAHIIDAIHAGDIYQANLTRKFTGELAESRQAFALFCQLSQLSPADFSAYVRMGERHILSSSPELFLQAQPDGYVASRPIKGSAPRNADPAADTALREALRTSAKNRAENLMIVDLVRNDLARCCRPGSIEVASLFDITTHRTIHHMASTVTGRLQPGISSLAAVKACFPPGSMTGAPKIRAMQLCSSLEACERGVYSGALGWLGGDGAAHLSVVIRTLLLEGRRFEFQVGGGVVADSTPEGELSEHLDKAAALANLLGIERQTLETL